MSERYNGWSNWDTWSVYSAITNDEKIYSMATKIVESMKKDGKNISDIASTLESALEVHGIDQVHHDVVRLPNAVWVLSDFRHEANWPEIVKGLTEDESEGDSEDSASKYDDTEEQRALDQMEKGISEAERMFEPDWNVDCRRE